MEIGTIVAGILTLAILTFLYRDNAIYKMAESLLIGVSIGYFLVITWTSTLVDLLFQPLFSDGRFSMIIPGLLGLLMFSRFIPGKAAWSRIAMAVMIGSGAGVAIPAMLDARILQQISNTVASLHTHGSFEISGLVVLVGVLTTLSYFFFSHEHTGALGYSARVGTWFLMIFFGTTFGYTVMSRMSTFIGRMEFLLSDFLGLI